MGGSQYQAKCLIEALQRTDKYEIFYLTRGSDPEYSAKGYSLIRYEYFGAHKQGSHQHLFEMAILPKLLRRIDPDIIYQRVGCAQTGIAAHYAEKNQCNMVWHIAHEYDLDPYRIPVSRLMVHRLLDRCLLNYGIRHATHIIAQTEDQKQLLQKNFRKKPSAVIPNFHPAPQKTLAKGLPVSVVWVANFKKLKQPEIFIRLASELRDLPGVRFLMVGAIQEGNRQKQKYLEAIRQIPSLEYLGPKRQEDVNDILARSHIFVNTSLREGFPNTFIQAWFRSVPVVSLTVNPDHLIDRHRLGRVSGDFERLKQDVALLAADQVLRERLGTNARHFAYQHFSTQNVDDIMRILDDSP